jgi:hypothetical protein
MLVDVNDKSFSSYLSGNWEQADKKGWNWLDSVEVKDDMIHISRRKVRPDPDWDHTYINKIEKVRVSDQRQYLISCEWDQQSTVHGLSRKVVPSQFSYVVWPITNDVMWLKQVGRHWLKFTRVK